MLEMAIVIAIFGVMAYLATTLINGALPSWRTRRAAMDFMASLQQARMRATGDGVQYRVVLRQFDSSPGDLSANYGEYTIEKGDNGVYSETWDILPVDMTLESSDSSLGTINIASGEGQALPKVSIEQWASIVGISDDGLSDIVFSPRGFLDNPASDFEPGNGYIAVSFINKAAYAEGTIDRWTVYVSRGGEVKMESGRNAWVPAGGSTGTEGNSTYTSDAPGFTLGASAEEGEEVPLDN